MEQMEQQLRLQQMQMQQQLQQSDEIEIDLMELISVLWRKAHLIAITALAGILAAAAVTTFLITPQYSGTSQLYVLTKSTSITSIADIQLGTQLTKDYEILITSRRVITEMLQNLNLDLDYEEAKKLIEVENPADSRVLNITVTHPDPQVAADMANETAKVMAKDMAEIMSTDEPSIVDTAVVAEKPVSPSLLKNCAIGGLLGFLLSAGIIVLLHLMDDTVKSVEDVERYLGITVLAAIPRKQGEVLHEKRSRRSKMRRKSR